MDNGGGTSKLDGLHGLNRAYLEEALLQSIEDPDAVPAELREAMSALGFTDAKAPEAIIGPGPVRRSIFGGAALSGDRAAIQEERKRSAVMELIEAYRRNGHLVAQLDPLGIRKVDGRPELEPLREGLEADDLERSFPTGSLWGPPRQTLREIVEQLQSALRDL